MANIWVRAHSLIYCRLLCSIYMCVCAFVCIAVSFYVLCATELRYAIPNRFMSSFFTLFSLSVPNYKCPTTNSAYPVPVQNNMWKQMLKCPNTKRVFNHFHFYSCALSFQLYTHTSPKILSTQIFESMAKTKIVEAREIDVDDDSE